MTATHRQHFIDAMRQVASTVTVVTTDGPAGQAGATVSAFSSLSADPPSVLVCLKADTRIAETVAGNGTFCVNILSEDHVEIAQRFAGAFDRTNPGRFEGLDVIITEFGPTTFQGPISASAPNDLILAAGAQGQFIAISPSQKLIMIRQGQSEDDGLAALDIHNSIWRQLSEIIAGDDCEAVVTNTDTQQDADISIFPIPTSDRLTITGLSPSSSINLTLTTLSGKQVLQSDDTNIDISSLENGIYLLHLYTGDQHEVRRILKVD